MENFLEIMKEYVLVPRTDYEKSIVNKKLIEEATTETQNYVDKYKSVYETISRTLNTEPNVVLDVLFKSERMGTDSRGEQLDLDGGYAGFSKKARIFLNSQGVSDAMLKDYINAKWDEYDDNMGNK